MRSKDKSPKTRKALNRPIIKKLSQPDASEMWENNPELDDDWFKRARPAAEILPKLIGQEATDRLLARSRGMRGPQKSPTKVPISIRLDSDVVDHYRALGAGWQAQINADLRQNLNGLSDTVQAEYTPALNKTKTTKSQKAKSPLTKATPSTKKRKK